ncbi:MAG: FecR domain-containing protein [Lachnospiraceae bacterium]|nr:FecR domain-containing protein [Lachnospiraceae bacterium]
MNKKLLAIIGGVVALIAIIVACIFIFVGGEDSYRSIKVFEIDGLCTVDRDGDTLDAFKNMSLSSGDSFTVGEGSFARLKLDDDKYVYLEANTKINLTATGTANDSKTMVYIERGSMLTEVKKKLSATSSYDIVTPNTTMSIRGTKTLTEVYEDVLGAIKTNAAVVEGQVSFKTIQKDSTGKAVIVTTDLSVGQGLGVTTDSKDLLSQEDVKHIADDGKTVDGQTAEETTHEELGTTLETPAFSEDFLTNIVAVLARSREEDIEEGFVAEDVTEEELNAAINILNDVIDGKVELPAAVEEYVVSQTQPYYDEPIYDTPVTGGNDDTTPAQQSVESEPEQITDDTVIPEDSEGSGDDTFVVDGTGETLVGIDDETDGTNDNDADVTDDGSDDRTDDSDDTDDESDDTDDTDDTDDNDNVGEDGDDENDVDDETDDSNDKDDKTDEDGDNGDDKENSDDVTGDGSEGEDSASGTDETDAQSTQDDSTSDPNTSDQRPDTSDAQESGPSGDSGSSSNTGTSTESTTVSYSDSHWDFSIENQDAAAGTTQERRSWSVRPVYRDSGNNVVSYSSLPTTPGTPLPGSSGSSYTVTLDVQGDIPADTQYEFAGWYRSSAGATECRESERVTTVPSDGVTLFPGIREVTVTYTVRFVNLFPEAGMLTVPSQDSWGDYTFREDEDPEAEWVEITGIHSGDVIHFPMTSDYLSYYSINPSSCLHIENKFNEISNDLTEFAGIGIGTKGSDGIVRGGDDINLARILLGDADYAASVASDFVRYDTGSTSDYMLDTEIRSDMTFYLYFSTAVTLTVPKGGDTPVRMLDSDGTADTATVLAHYGFDYTQAENLASYAASQNAQTTPHGRSHAAPQLLKLRTGSTQDKDQYWGVFLNYLNNDVESDPIYVFKTYYFGNSLDIPSFEVAQSKANLYDLSAKLIVTGNEDVVPDGHAEKTYVNTPTSGVNAMTISRTSQTSSWFVGNGRLVYNSLGFELDESRFVTLDLTNSGANQSIGMYAQNLIRKHRDSEDGVFRLKVEKHSLSGYFYNVALIPEDGGYDWASGGTEREVPPTDQNSTYLSKDGMRLAGYSVTYLNGQTPVVRNAIVNKTYSAWPVGDDTVFLDRENEEYIVKLEHVTSDRAYVLKPIFLPAGSPFEIGIERQSGKIIRPSSAEVDWAISDYELTISGLKDMIDAGYPVSMIDLRSIRAKCYNYGRNNNAYYDVSFDKLLYWDATRCTYDLYVRGNSEDTPVRVGGNSVRYTLQNDGTLRIPLKDLGTFTLFVDSNTILKTEFIRGIGFADYGTPLDNYDIIQQYVSYQIESLLPNRDLGRVSGTPTTFAEYTPGDSFVGIKANHDYRYTAVYTQSGNGPRLVFNESGSEPISDTGDLLQVITEIEGDGYPGLVFYGGELSEVAYGSGMLSDQELAAIFPRTVTRTETASGRPEAVIKGDADLIGKYGCGVLEFKRYVTINIINPNNVIVYSPNVKNRLSTITSTQGLSSEYDYSTLRQFLKLGTDAIMPSNVRLSLSMSNNDSCPDGWAYVEYNNDSGYVYYGSGTVEGQVGCATSTPLSIQPLN